MEMRSIIHRDATNMRSICSKMTLFPFEKLFATQATEQVPGASIEKPRVWVINLAAYLRTEDQFI